MRVFFCFFLTFSLCVCKRWAAIESVVSAKSNWNICFPTPTTLPGYAALSMADSGENSLSPDTSQPVSTKSVYYQDSMVYTGCARVQVQVQWMLSPKFQTKDQKLNSRLNQTINYPSTFWFTLCFHDIQLCQHNHQKSSFPSPIHFCFFIHTLSRQTVEPTIQLLHIINYCTVLLS